MEMGLSPLHPSENSSVCGKSVSFAESPSAPSLDFLEEGLVKIQKSRLPRRGILKSPKRACQFPVKILKYKMLAEIKYLKICEDAPVYLAGVLEYLVTRVFALTSSETLKTNKISKIIEPRHLQCVFKNNEELCDLMTGEDRSILAMN